MIRRDRAARGRGARQGPDGNGILAHVDSHLQQDTATLTTVATPDGRSVDVWLAGPEGGPVVVVHHGTPSHGKPDRTMQAAAQAVFGVRLVCPTRPGYAARRRARAGASPTSRTTSARRAGPPGAERAATAGWSGGGPHALATAAVLQGRIVAVASVAEVGPYGESDLDFLDGMGQDNLDEFGAAIDGESPLRAYLDAARPALLEVTSEQLVGELGSLLPPPDVRVLTGEFGEDLAAGFRTSLRPGVEGWLEDDLAFTHPWGFELDQVRVPAFVWQGDQDLMVPVAHGRWLASALPDARPHLLSGEGHLSISSGKVGEVLIEVTEPLRG